MLAEVAKELNQEVEFVHYVVDNSPARHLNDNYSDHNKYMAIINARHLKTPGFWQYTLPTFFNNGTKETIRLVQVPQTFEGVRAETDAFDHHNLGSVYIPKPLVFGAVKNPRDYGEAPTRWAAGAIQLLLKECRQDPWFAVYAILFFIVLPAFYTFLVVGLVHAEWS